MEVYITNVEVNHKSVVLQLSFVSIRARELPALRGPELMAAFQTVVLGSSMAELQLFFAKSVTLKATI